MEHISLRSVAIVSVESNRHNVGMADLAALFSELIRLETELWNRTDRRLREECGLPLNRFEPMREIERRGRCRVLDVAAALAIGVSGTSKLIDRIEEAGLCERLANPEDGRSVMVALTPDGRKLLARAESVFAAELEAQIGSVLSSTEVAELTAMLVRLRAS